MQKVYYHNFYKLQMAMQGNNSNVVIFGPESSGKCEALERCMEQFSMTGKVAIFTSKGVLQNFAHRNENIDCYDWHGEKRKIDCDLIDKDYDVLLIDGYCENWVSVLNRFPNTRVIMTVRAASFNDVSLCLKQQFGIVAKTGFVKNMDGVKGILTIKKFGNKNA